MDARELLTVADVARQLKVSPETVREWLRTGQLSGYNLGGQAGWRVRATDVDRLLQTRFRQSHD